MKHLLLLAFGIPLMGLAQNIDSASYYFQKGIEEQSKQRWLVASQHFSKSLAFNAKNADVHLKAAENYVQMRDLYKAGLAYENLLKEFPGHKQGLEAITNFYFTGKQYKKAKEYALLCADCAIRDKVLGIAYYKEEEFPTAEKHLLNYLKANPNDAEANYTLARVYGDMDYDQKAFSYYQKAIQLDPKNPKWAFEAGVIMFNAGKFKEAVAAYELAKANGFTNSLEFKEQLGYAYLSAGEFDKGEEQIMAVHERRPSDTELLLDISELLYKKGQYDRSLAYCQRLLEKDPKNGKAMYQAGLNFIKKGEKDKGGMLCDKAIEIDPALARLRKEVKM